MTNRIILRSLKTKDKSAVFDLLTDDCVMKFLGPRRALSNSKVQQWFEDELASPSRYAVALTDSDELIGFCGIKIIDGISDFGYFFRKAFWGKGYASESCLLVINKLQQEININCLQVFIAKHNSGSLSVANKLGWLRLFETIKAGEQGYYFQISK